MRRAYRVGIEFTDARKVSDAQWNLRGHAPRLNGEQGYYLRRQRVSGLFLHMHEEFCFYTLGLRHSEAPFLTDHWMRQDLYVCIFVFIKLVLIQIKA